MARLGKAWLGWAWLGMAWLGTARHGADLFTGVTHTADVADEVPE